MLALSKNYQTFLPRPFDGFLPSDHVVYGTRITSQRQALAIIAEKAATFCDASFHDILHAFCEREKLGSTALGNGIALPHARIPNLEESFAVFLRSRTAVPFDAPDDIGVEFFFALLVPDASGTKYLHDISRIARLLRSPQVRHGLKDEDTAQGLWQILRQAYVESNLAESDPR